MRSRYGRPLFCFPLMALAVFCGLLMFGAGPAWSADGRVALVIGNGTYRSVAPLANAANDARLMATTLTGLGFRLVGGKALTDLDKAGFDRAVQEFGEQISGADVALFYYAGHGVQVRGSNFLVPVSANPTRETDVDFQMVDVQLVLRQMEAGGTRLNMLILDACRNNPFGGTGLRAAGGGLAQMRAPAGTLLSYATQPGNVAADGSDGHSPFTAALTQTMRRPGLGVWDVFNQVGLEVKSRTGGAQQPWVSNSPIEGQFYFVPSSAGAVPVVTHDDPEVVFWQTIANSRNPSDFRAYLNQYPNGRFAALARSRAALEPETPVTAAAVSAAPAHPGLLGVAIRPVSPDIARTQGRPDTAGAAVIAVDQHGPAAGLLRAGDIVLRMNGTVIDAASTLPPLIASAGAGATVPLVVWRDGVQQSLRVRLGELTAREKLAGDALMQANQAVQNKNFTDAARWYRTSADNGNASAMTVLGQLYVNGQGVTKDVGEGLRWLRLAADQGDVESMNDLGRAYATGLGVAKDCAMAKRWLDLSAAGGFAGARASIQTGVGGCSWN